MKATVYTQHGKKSSEIELPEEIFNTPWNTDLVHQVLSVQRANQNSSTTHAKDRSERRGGGRKPWRQKGTGRARHGSNRSPIWRKGGVTHGPTNKKNTARSINQKMKRKALYALLSQKHRDGEVVFVDSFSFDAPRTREAKASLVELERAIKSEDLAKRRRNAAYIALSEKNESTTRSFHNLGNVHLDDVRNMSPLDVARYKYLVIENPEQAFEWFQTTIKKDQAAPASATAK